MVAPQPAPHPPQQGNGLAVAGLVLGIVGLALCWFPFVGQAAAIVGIILGALGISKAGKLAGKGKGMAVAGLICGILGLLIGIVLVVLSMMAVSAFDDYMKKGKRSEASLQLRSIEKRAKSFYIEKMRLPKTASMMPGPAGSGCGSPGAKLQRKPMTEWMGAGWDELGFHVDEDSLYSYQWTVTGAPGQGQTGEAIAVGDLDCDGTMSTYRMTIKIVDGNPMATYEEPSSPD